MRTEPNHDPEDFSHAGAFGSLHSAVKWSLQGLKNARKYLDEEITRLEAREVELGKWESAWREKMFENHKPGDDDPTVPRTDQIEQVIHEPRTD